MSLILSISPGNGSSWPVSGTTQAKDLGQHLPVWYQNYRWENWGKNLCLLAMADHLSPSMVEFLWKISFSSSSREKNNITRGFSTIDSRKKGIKKSILKFISYKAVKKLLNTGVPLLLLAIYFELQAERGSSQCLTYFNGLVMCEFGG